MKKIILSLFVIISFVFYSIHERTEGSEAQILAPKQANPSTNSTSDQTVVPSSPPAKTTTFRNGSYTGDVTDAFYGNVQVRAVITNGRLSDIEILDYPSDRRTSEVINGEALPILIQEAIQAQHAEIDLVSGATDTSMAFRQSLASALTQAQ